MAIFPVFEDPAYWLVRQQMEHQYLVSFSVALCFINKFIKCEDDTTLWYPKLFAETDGTFANHQSLRGQHSLDNAMWKIMYAEDFRNNKMKVKFIECWECFASLVLLLQWIMEWFRIWSPHHSALYLRPSNHYTGSALAKLYFKQCLDICLQFFPYRFYRHVTPNGHITDISRSTPYYSIRHSPNRDHFYFRHVCALCLWSQ